MTSNTSKLSLPLRQYKTLYGFITPLLGVILVLFGIMCCFKPAKASSSRTICIIGFAVTLAVMVVLWLIHQRLSSKSYSYQIYQSNAVRRFNPGVLFPLLLMVVVVVFPFYILLITSFKSPLESLSIQFSWWPKEFDLQSYREMLTYDSIIGVSMGKAVLNSFIYAIIPTVVGLFVSAASAYCFSKMEFPGRKLMYSLLIMTMMMPGCVTMTTSYIMFNWYGWINTPMPLIVPGCFGAAATVMFLREFYMGIPNGLLEAARIDGAGKWKSFFFVMLPLGKPALIAQFILGFITKYNDYLSPLIYLNEPQGYTIQVALDMINVSVLDKSMVATAGVLSLAPMFLLYVIFQKRIINGISMSSGLKG